jgi:hypothetical protein
MTNHGLKGLAQRCRKIESAIFRGCDKITDKGLLSMTETVMDRHQHKYPMCETFKHLDMSYCSGITSGCLKVSYACVSSYEVHI